jgi:hypothetical protein
MPDAAVALVTPDARAAEVPAHDHQKGASSTHPGHSATEQKPLGAIHVTAMPALTVFVDGKPYGDTPKTIPLKPGPHKVRLTNESGTDETFPVTIVSGETKEIPRFK